MKKAFQIIGVCALTCFSFYYTDKVIEVSRNNDPIMKEIVSKSNDYNVESVNALISSDTIKSGIKGNVVDTSKSYEKMKSLGEYNENLLVFTNVDPKISIKDNYDKFVVGASDTKRDVAICFTISDSKYINNIIKILKDNDVDANIFLDGKLIEENEDIVKNIVSNNLYMGNLGYDGGYDTTKIKYTNSLIYRYGGYASKYCYSDSKDVLDICSKENMYTIKAIEIDPNYPYSSLKENLSNGVILKFSDSKITVNNLSLMLKYIKQKGYSIKILDDLLME